MFSNVFDGKKVLVTGHTGFKGTWMTIWLQQMGAEVVGISDKVPTDPAHFIAAGLEDSMKTHWLDIRCLLYTSPSPRDRTRSRMPSSA